MAAVTSLDDPYKALGVPKDATINAIKSAYRKLVLTCHPDKVTDETLRAQKAEDFHKIQKAYEKIGDQDARDKHDAEVRLAELRKEKMEREGRSGSYASANSSSYRSPRSAAVFEERRPSFDSDFFEQAPRASARKHEEYPTSRRSPPRATRTEHYSEKEKEKYRRAERERVREQEERRERDMKKSYFEEEIYEEDRRRRDREPEKPRTETYKIRGEPSSLESELLDKMESARAHMASVRPSSHRTASSQSYDVRRSRAPAKEAPRSSRRSGSAERYRERIVPILESHKSEPAKMEIPSTRARSPPRRSYTTQGDFDLRRTPEEAPHPGIRRTDSAPAASYTMSPSSRRKETHAPQPSRLRTSTTPHDSGYSSNSGPGSPEAAHGFHPEIPSAQAKPTSTRYYYPDNSKDSGKYNYEIRTPGSSSRQKSPSPPRERVRESERPPLASYGPSYSSSRSGRYSYTSATEQRRPTVVRHSSSSTNAAPRLTRSPERLGRSERERERERDYHYERDDHDRPTTKLYYGEVPRSSSKDSGNYAPENINVRRTYRPEDAASYKDFAGYGAAKPGLERSQTYHYVHA